MFDWFRRLVNPPRSAESVAYEDFYNRVTAMEKRVSEECKAGKPAWPTGPGWEEMTKEYASQFEKAATAKESVSEWTTQASVRAWFTPGEVMAYAERKGVRLE